MSLLIRRAKFKRGNAKIGTTGRGIGPAYEDKVARRGLRLGDIFNPQSFAEKLKEVMEYHNFALVNYYGVDALDFDTVLADALAWGEELKTNGVGCYASFAYRS